MFGYHQSKLYILIQNKKILKTSTLSGVPNAIGGNSVEARLCVNKEPELWNKITFGPNNKHEFYYG